MTSKLVIHEYGPRYHNGKLWFPPSDVPYRQTCIVSVYPYWVSCHVLSVWHGIPVWQHSPWSKYHCFSNKQGSSRYDLRCIKIKRCECFDLFTSDTRSIYAVVREKSASTL